VPLLNAGVAVGVGTDGAASNNNLSLWEEVSAAALLAKGAADPARGMQRSAVSVPARVALELATRRAASALKQRDIGQLAPGMRGDAIVVELDGIHLTPRYRTEGSLYSHLVYSAQASDVRETVVQGRVLMKDRELLTLDEAALRSRAQAWVDEHYGAG
jgi:5-methylthioadenosine/S-adenosylhomocysteine deaminase